MRLNTVRGLGLIYDSDSYFQSLSVANQILKADHLHIAIIDQRTQDYVENILTKCNQHNVIEVD